MSLEIPLEKTQDRSKKYYLLLKKSNLDEFEMENMVKYNVSVE